MAEGKRCGVAGVRVVAENPRRAGSGTYLRYSQVRSLSPSAMRWAHAPILKPHALMQIHPEIPVRLLSHPQVSAARQTCISHKSQVNRHCIQLSLFVQTWGRFSRIRYLEDVRKEEQEPRLNPAAKANRGEDAEAYPPYDVPDPHLEGGQWKSGGDAGRGEPAWNWTCAARENPPL